MDKFAGKSLPTRALGAMFTGRAAELAAHGRHPYFRVVCAHRHLFSTLPPDDVVKSTLVAWMQGIYQRQMGSVIKAGLALATAVKFASVMSHKDGADDSGLTDAAEVFFHNAQLLNSVTNYFGHRTKWESIADALIEDGRERYAAADESVFAYPEGDDPECPAEGPSLDDIRAALGLEDEEHEEPNKSAVEQNPPDNQLADMLAAFPAIKKRVKPSDN